jgi:hypothetical protein
MTIPYVIERGNIELCNTFNVSPSIWAIGLATNLPESLRRCFYVGLVCSVMLSPVKLKFSFYKFCINCLFLMGSANSLWSLIKQVPSIKVSDQHSACIFCFSHLI